MFRKRDRHIQPDARPSVVKLNRATPPNISANPLLLPSTTRRTCLATQEPLQPLYHHAIAHTFHHIGGAPLPHENLVQRLRSSPSTSRLFHKLRSVHAQQPPQLLFFLALTSLCSVYPWGGGASGSSKLLGTQPQRVLRSANSPLPSQAEGEALRISRRGPPPTPPSVRDWPDDSNQVVPNCQTG